MENATSESRDAQSTSEDLKESATEKPAISTPAVLAATDKPANPVASTDEKISSVSLPDSGQPLYEDSALYARKSAEFSKTGEENIADENLPDSGLSPNALSTMSFELTAVPTVSISAYINDSIITSPTTQLHTFTPITPLAMVSVITENTLLDSILGKVEIDPAGNSASGSTAPENIITPDSVILEAVKSVGSISEQIDEPDVSTTVTENLQIVTAVTSFDNISGAVDDAYADSLIYNFLIDTTNYNNYTQVPDESFVSFENISKAPAISDSALAAKKFDANIITQPAEDTDTTTIPDAIFNEENMAKPGTLESASSEVAVGDVISVRTKHSVVSKAVDENLSETPRPSEKNNPSINQQEIASAQHTITTADSEYLRIEIAKQFEEETQGIIETENLARAKFYLSKNYGDPYAPTAKFRYRIPAKGTVQLEIFNETGQRVRTLVNQVQEAGDYKIEWDKKNSAEQPVASGVYICRLETGAFVKAQKILVLR